MQQIAKVFDNKDSDTQRLVSWTGRSGKPVMLCKSSEFFGGFLAGSSLRCFWSAGLRVLKPKKACSLFDGLVSEHPPDSFKYERIKVMISVPNSSSIGFLVLSGWGTLWRSDGCESFGRAERAGCLGSQLSKMTILTKIDDTPQKTNMEPENEPLEEEIPNLETIIFRCKMLVFGGASIKIIILINYTYREAQDQPFLNGSFSWMSPIFFDLVDGCFTNHSFKTGCFGVPRMYIWFTFHYPRPSLFDSWTWTHGEKNLPEVSPFQCVFSGQSHRQWRLVSLAFFFGRSAELQSNLYAKPS